MGSILNNLDMVERSELGTHDHFCDSAAMSRGQTIVARRKVANCYSICRIVIAAKTIVANSRLQENRLGVKN